MKRDKLSTTMVRVCPFFLFAFQKESTIFKKEKHNCNEVTIKTDG